LSPDRQNNARTHSYRRQGLSCIDSGRSGVVRMSNQSSGDSERCPECGRQITAGPSGVEYGHERGIGETGDTERCSRRPDCVDPVRDAPDHDDWILPGGETA